MSKDSKIMKGSLIAALISGIVASICCIGPFVLLSLGVGTAFAGTLTQFAFLRPVAIVFALVFLGLAFWKLYFPTKACDIKKSCACSAKYTLFWIVSLIVAIAIVFPWI